MRKIWSVERYAGLLIDYVARTSKTTVTVASQPSEDDLLVSDILGLPPEHFGTEKKICIGHQLHARERRGNIYSATQRK